MQRLRLVPPVIIAHRGYRQRFPENTLAAFAAAFGSGAPMVELDVTLTRDRLAVVLHDDTLERTTNGRGQVRDFTLEELKRLDAGSWFDPRFAGERLPSLEEALDLCAARGMVNIEIKAGAFEADRPADAIEEQVLRAVAQRDMNARVLVSSFDARFLARIAESPVAPAIGLLTDARSAVGPLSLCQRLRAFSWHPEYRGVTAEKVREMHAAGIKVLAYTVNRQADFLRLLQMGVDGVFSDDPPLLQACIDRGAACRVPASQQF
ncbi:MAG: glycerophosphodiester phosphodiesterase family protein [Desulfobacterales bacterium]